MFYPCSSSVAVIFWHMHSHSVSLGQECAFEKKHPMVCAYSAGFMLPSSIQKILGLF